MSAYNCMCSIQPFTDLVQSTHPYTVYQSTDCLLSSEEGIKFLLTSEAPAPVYETVNQSIDPRFHITFYRHYRQANS